MISIIAAIAKNGVIGNNNALPWHFPADLKYFKETTLTHTVVMGRKTYESFGAKPLPGRRNVIITRNEGYPSEGIEVCNSLSSAFELIADDGKVFICGGAEIYREALPIADKLFITRVDYECEGDALFPEIDQHKWSLVSETFVKADEVNEYDLIFQEYER